MTASPATLPWHQDPAVLTAHRARVDEPEPEPGAPVDFSGPIDVVNLLLVRAGCPGKHRAYIDALLGAADNRTDSFEATDLEIGRRLRGEDAERITKASVKKAAQRARDEFDEWQCEAHLTLVVSAPGGSADGMKKVKTQYRLPVLALAQQAYAEARLHPLWRTRPDRAVSVAAKAALAELRHEPPRRERFRRSRSITVSMLVARAARAIAKAIDLAARRCGAAEDVAAEFVAALTDEGRTAIAQALTHAGVEHSGSTVPFLREEDRTSDPHVNVVPFPPVVAPEAVDAPTVDESVHSQEPAPDNCSAVTAQRAPDPLDEVARDAEALFGPPVERPPRRTAAAPEPRESEVDRFARVKTALLAIRSGNEWLAHCPAHDDASASLWLTFKRGKFFAFCRSQKCAFEDIMAAIDAGAFVARRPKRKSSSRKGSAAGGARRVVARFVYRDEQGRSLYQSVRYDPKGFSQERYDRGRFVVGAGAMNGVRLVPYRLPELLAADPDEPVCVVEGEKHVDLLASLGFVATCNVGGAGKWRAEYSEHLRGRHVVILPDSDEAGQKHGRLVAGSLKGIAAAVHVLELPGLPPKGDVLDWIAAGGTADELRRLASGEEPAKTTDTVSAVSVVCALGHAGCTNAGCERMPWDTEATL